MAAGLGAGFAAVEPNGSAHFLGEAASPKGGGGGGPPEGAGGGGGGPSEGGAGGGGCPSERATGGLSEANLELRFITSTNKFINNKTKKSQLHEFDFDIEATGIDISSVMAN